MLQKGKEMKACSIEIGPILSLPEAALELLINSLVLQTFCIKDRKSIKNIKSQTEGTRKPTKGDTALYFLRKAFIYLIEMDYRLVQSHILLLHELDDEFRATFNDKTNLL